MQWGTAPVKAEVVFCSLSTSLWKMYEASHLSCALSHMDWVTGVVWEGLRLMTCHGKGQSHGTELIWSGWGPSQAAVP